MLIRNRLNCRILPPKKLSGRSRIHPKYLPLPTPFFNKDTKIHSNCGRYSQFGDIEKVIFKVASIRHKYFCNRKGFAIEAAKAANRTHELVAGRNYLARQAAFYTPRRPDGKLDFSPLKQGKLPPFPVTPQTIKSVLSLNRSLLTRYPFKQIFPKHYSGTAAQPYSWYLPYGVYQEAN